MQLNEIDFSTLDIHEIGAWPLVLRVVIIVVACIVSVFVVYFLILSGDITSLEAQKLQLENKRKDFKEKYNMAVNLDAYKKQMQEMQSTYSDLLKELPATSDIPNLVDSISRAGEANYIKFSAIKIGEPQSSGGFYMELPISFSLVGTYHNIGKFISEILKLPRIVTIGDFSLRVADSEVNSGSSKGQLQMNLEVKTYWLSNNNDDKNNANSAEPNAQAPNPSLGTSVVAPGSAPSAETQAPKTEWGGA